jgi:hypothetical protein
VDAQTDEVRWKLRARSGHRNINDVTPGRTVLAHVQPCGPVVRRGASRAMPALWEVFRDQVFCPKLPRRERYSPCPKPLVWWIRGETPVKVSIAQAIIAIPPGAFNSIVFDGPRKDQRRPQPSFRVLSGSRGLTAPSPAGSRLGEQGTLQAVGTNLQPPSSQPWALGRWTVDASGLLGTRANAVASVVTVRRGPTSRRAPDRWRSATCAWARP